MKLDLRELIEAESGAVGFDCTLDAERLAFPALVRFQAPPAAHGRVVNSAGALSLRGEISCSAVCICDRCMSEYDFFKTNELDVPLAAELEDEENPDIFLLDGDTLELDEVLETCFILDMDMKFLCREDCKGLCPQCGANLNLGPCACRADLDPRMAVLGQLLDTEDE